MYIAGHYVPATAQVIVESNSVYSKNLKGIGIGNGWVDPVIQYKAYAQASGRASGWDLGVAGLWSVTLCTSLFSDHTFIYLKKYNLPAK